MTYPSTADISGTVVDLVDKVMAAHVNNLRTAVSDLGSALGSSALISNWSESTQGVITTSTWGTVHDRVQNIERALRNGWVTGGAFLNKSGDTITATSGVGLTVKGYNTSNILETKTSANALGFYIDSSGIPQVDVSGSAKAVLYVGNTEYQSIMDTLDDLNANVLGDGPINLLMLSGM